MKAKLMVAAVASALFAAGAWAQMGPGWGGYGPGGYGPGGYGPVGYGPRGGQGAWMMGAAGPRGYAGLNLTDEQRGKIEAIQAEFSSKQGELMEKMHVQRSALYGADASARPDDATARKIYEGMSETRKAMFENRLEMGKRIDAVLTDEQRGQRGQLRRGGCRFG